MLEEDLKGGGGGEGGGGEGREVGVRMGMCGGGGRGV